MGYLFLKSRGNSVFLNVSASDLKKSENMSFYLQKLLKIQGFSQVEKEFVFPEIRGVLGDQLSEQTLKCNVKYLTPLKPSFFAKT